MQAAPASLLIQWAWGHIRTLVNGPTWSTADNQDGALSFDGSNNSVRGYLTNGGQVEVAGGSTLAAQTWTHLALTYDGTTMRLYVDGTQVAQQSASGSMVATTGALELGGNTSYGNEWFAGLLDDVRLYNRALSAREIALDQGSGVGDQRSGAITRTQADGDRGQATEARGQESGSGGQDAVPDADGTASRPLTPDPRSLRGALPNADSPLFTRFGKALLRQLQQSVTTTTRTITYDDDGLQRLKRASESPGTIQTSSYDLAGNRTGVCNPNISSLRHADEAGTTAFVRSACSLLISLTHE